MLVYVSVLKLDELAIGIVTDTSADDERSTEQVNGHSRPASGDFYDFVTVIIKLDLEEQIGDEAL